MNEDQIIRKIKQLKELLDDCKTIETELRDICLLINAEWDCLQVPSVISIQNAIQTKLIDYRSKLAELRGE